MALLDATARFIRVNGRMAAINGVTTTAHVGRTIDDVAPENAEAVRATIAQVLTDKTTVTAEIEGTSRATPDAPRTWRTHWMPLFDAVGGVHGVLCIAEDITEAATPRRREAALARAVAAERDRLRGAFDQSTPPPGRSSCSSAVVHACVAPRSRTVAASPIASTAALQPVRSHPRHRAGRRTPCRACDNASSCASSARGDVSRSAAAVSRMASAVTLSIGGPSAVSARRRWRSNTQPARASSAKAAAPYANASTSRAR
ncbi:MAG: PAS domain-containing protein [Gemmatimonadaceae bacterium]|nr:PAS domain-containing protein [Gemmatimonadaceae bacterium]